MHHGRATTVNDMKSIPGGGILGVLARECSINGLVQDCSNSSALAMDCRKINITNPFT